MKKNVAVVGATGIAGQQFIAALQNHPWFEIRCLSASQKSAGKKYVDALRDEKTNAMKWYCGQAINDEVAGMVVVDSDKLDASGYDLVFTAVESDVAKTIEPKYAESTPVISTASAFRYEDDVPVIITGINNEHAELIRIQKQNRGWNGFITPIPNCTTTGLAVTLKPLERFGIEKVLMTSLQAVSGAGRSPGVVALDITDNVIPFIVGEERKVETETKKILGSFGDGKITPARFGVSCTCTRVNVLEGHTECVFVALKERPSIDDVKRTFRDFNPLAALNLPSAPKQFIIIHDDEFRPQPRLDRNNENGMATSVGRIRVDDVLNGIKYVLVSHNTRMGAAAGAVLLAEFLAKQGFV